MRHRVLCSMNLFACQRNVLETTSEAAFSSKTLTKSYQNTGRHIPEESIFNGFEFMNYK